MRASIVWLLTLSVEGYRLQDEAIQGVAQTWRLSLGRREVNGYAVGPSMHGACRQGWEAAGYSAKWAREVGLDTRGLHFAREVRRQLAGMMAAAGPRLLPEASAACAKAIAEERRGREAAPSPAALPSAKRKREGFEGFESGTDGLRRALLVGFANRLARRMARHNGYRTLNDRGTLAQLHPSTARIAADEDGLTPEFLIYHELIATARIFLSKVTTCLFLCHISTTALLPNKSSMH